MFRDTDEDGFGIDTDTSSLNRVAIGRRTEPDFVETERLGSSLGETAAFLSTLVPSCDSAEEGLMIFALLEERLDPELSFLRIGGRRVAVCEVLRFSLEVSSDLSSAAMGLVGVGVTELSSGLGPM